MRIGQVLLAAACASSGIMVFGATAAAAQSYTGAPSYSVAPSYSGAGYQRPYSAGLQASYRGNYPGNYPGDDRSGGYYLPDNGGYAPPTDYVSYDPPSYEPPRYVTPTYGQPVYGRPVYRPPVVIEPAPCHDRSW